MFFLRIAAQGVIVHKLDTKEKAAPGQGTAFFHFLMPIAGNGKMAKSWL
jgi:hypothetical protein